jgi:1-deoxy-D-xylulose 5-phosphate reductoisomerase
MTRSLTISGATERLFVNLPRLVLAAISRLTCERVVRARFSRFAQAKAEHQVEGSALAVLNAMNKISVKGRVAERVGFYKILEMVEEVCSSFSANGRPTATVAVPLALNGKARVMARRFIPSKHI